MTCDVSRERLQEQIDGTLDPARAHDLERHLAGCASCRGLAADLTAIVDGAASFDHVNPPEHVWLKLAGRWRREHTAPGGQHSSTAISSRARGAWHLLAVAAVLAVAAGGGWLAWRVIDTGAPPASSSSPSAAATTVLLAKPTEDAGNAAGADLVESAQKDIEAAEQLYAGAIARLEQAVEGQKQMLDPQVATMLEKNFEVLDEAIVESRTAARAEPQSPVARESLFDALRKKVTLLQNTISLLSEISRGNQAAASRLAGT